jgi:hypothetical protein
MTDSDPRLLVLHTLRLGGFVPADRIAARTGVAPETVATVLERATADGHAAERSGRLAGWVLTPDGRAAHASLLAEEVERSDARAAVETADEAFLALNDPFKQLCTRWQLRPDGSPNDHADAAYDRSVVDDLEPVHRDVVALTDRLAGALSRFARYPRAFDDARRRLRDGDPRAFAAPLAESYHDAWMELHQDLLSTLGRERATADGH